jgi:protein gp37
VRDALATRLYHWVICGGESGPHARPMHEEWARSLRDQCLAFDVPYFFKQWGEYLPGTQYEPHHKARDTEAGDESSSDHLPYRVGKKGAGRLLDGREHNGMPSALRETAQSAVQTTEPS